MAIRRSTKELKARVLQLLREHEYINCEAIAQKIRATNSGVYRIIRLLREDGIGIMPGCNGYVLSEYATRRDDVHFLRKINGSYASAVLTVNACAKDINKRWHYVEHKSDIKMLLGNFSTNYDTLCSTLDQLKEI